MAALMHQDPIFASGSDKSHLTSSLRSLTPPVGRWSICSTGRGIERTFKFKTFKAAWAFMNDVAGACKSERHHPEWSNVYNAVFVRWTTHTPPGLSSVDVKMAGLCDELASSSELAMTGDEMEAEGDGKSHEGGLRDLADEGASRADDCCGKPEKERQRQEEKKKIEEEEDDPKGAQGSIAGIGGQPS